MTQQLDEKKVALVNEVNVDVSQHIEHMNRKPTHCKGGHQECDQAEDLPFTRLLGACLALRSVARRDTVPQFDCDAEVRHEDSGQRQDVRDQQGAVCISSSLLLLTQPELFADGEALVFELDVVGVRDCGGHQAEGQQPDAGEDGGAGRHRGALLQGVNCGVIPAVRTERCLMNTLTHINVGKSVVSLSCRDPPTCPQQWP